MAGISARLYDPKVVLLGAGASRGGLKHCNPPPPVDAEFFTVALQLKGHGTPKLAKRVLRSVWELYRKIDGIGLEQYYRDIETREAIAEIAKSNGKPKDWKRRRLDLEELIRRVYIQTTTNLSDKGPIPHKSEAHERILGSLDRRSTIITFNYDLLIEESFRTADLWSPQYGYGIKINGTTHEWSRKWYDTRLNPDGNKGSKGKKGKKKRKPLRKTKSKVKLLKLHGSLGWASYKNNVVKLKDRPYYVRNGKAEKISIRAPGWKKEISVNPYKKFWRAARLKLEHCQSLLIIGYSLPETDLLAMALFAEVVRKRVADSRYLRQLVVVDPNAEVRSKLIKLFTPTLGATGEILQFKDINQL